VNTNKKYKLVSWAFLLIFISVLITPATTALAESAAINIGTLRTAFQPNTIMTDTDGNTMDAHGAGIMYDKITAKYYWYGEYHKGTWPGSAVKVYSSTDLYNWQDEGNALTMIPTMDSFVSDPLISSIYAGRTDT
jgi:hypothetical protein